MGLPTGTLPPEGLTPDERSAVLLRAGHQWHPGTGTDALRAAAAALRDPAPAERRAEMRILADVFESEALRREGAAARAAELASGALVRARDLGHAWFLQTLRERSSI